MALIESLSGVGGTAIEELVKQSVQVPHGITNKELTALVLREWRGSAIINDMITANNYYLICNEAIAEKKRESDNLSNVQLASADYRSSVENKVNYAFGKPFVINVENIIQSDKKEDSIAEQYLNEWQKFIDKQLNKRLRRLSKNAINNGIAWAYPYINDKTGNLELKVVKSETLYPNWTDESHEQLNFIIRDYKVAQITNDETQVITKVEYWDDKVVERYIEKDGELIIDIESEDMQNLPFATAHMIRKNEKTHEAISWGRVPFIALKGNDDELPLLNMTKNRTDAIDMLDSKSVDSLIDDIDAILVLKNYSADIGDVEQARKLVKMHKVMSVQGDGGVDYLQLKSDITAIQTKLESLRKSVIRAGYDVDYEDIRSGGNPNQLVLKSIFQKLDTYVNGLESEFKIFMDNLKYFFDIWLEFKGIGTVEQWENYSIKVQLNRDMLINEDTDIKNLLELAKTNPDYTISIESLDGFNPMIDSYETEQSRREAEAAKKREEEQKSPNNDMIGFIEETRRLNNQVNVDEG